MVSYLTVVAIGSALTTFLGLLLLLWGADTGLRPLMAAGLLVIAGLALAWVVWVFAFMFVLTRAKLRKPE